MANRLRELVSFWDGLALTDQEIVLIGALDEQRSEPHTIVVKLDQNGQKAWNLDWSARRIVRHPLRGSAMIIGVEGEIVCLEDSALVAEPSIRSLDRAERPGRLLGARTIGGTCYVVGYNFQVLRFGGMGDWQPMEAGLPLSPAIHPSVAAFEAIDGYSAEELYAAGTHGALWRYNGCRWTEVPVTTNVRLTAVTVHPDGMVYVCGQSGVLLRGRGDCFELIQQDESIQYFWDVSWWDDRLFAASFYVLYTLDNKEIAPYPFADLREDENLPTSFLRFSSSPSWLWTIGDKDVIRLARDKWERIV